jgi:diacylglycerol O-acyltransferase / wax synthase
MSSRVERLGAGDLATLWAEEPGTRMHIGLAGLLDAGPLLDRAGRLRLAEVRAAVDARLARVPQLRRRIRWTGFGQGRPAVVDDQEFTIAAVVVAVDLAGLDERGFWSWCANHALEPFDRDHPLWRVVLATGLTGGRVGVLVVMHHALPTAGGHGASPGRWGRWASRCCRPLTPCRARSPRPTWSSTCCSCWSPRPC